MDWFAKTVLYVGLFDAGAILLGGAVGSFVILMGWDARKLWDRVFPAIAMLIGSNIAAAVTLWATRWLSPI